MQWLENDFFKYWEESITKAYPYLEPADKEQMQISQITLEGLTMTGMPFGQKFLLTTHMHLHSKIIRSNDQISI